MDKIQTWTRKPYEVEVMLITTDIALINTWLKGTSYIAIVSPTYGILIEDRAGLGNRTFATPNYHCLVKHNKKVKVLTLEQLEAEYEQRQD